MPHGVAVPACAIVVLLHAWLLLQVLGAAYPWVSRRLLLTTNSPELTATLDNLLYDSKGRFNFDRLESLLEQAAKARVTAKAPASSSAAAAAQPSTLASGTSNRNSSSSLQSGSTSGTAGQQPGLLASVAAAVGGALAGPEGSELLVSSLQILSGSNGGGWQQQVSGRGSAAAAAGGPLALVLSPEGRHIRGKHKQQVSIIMTPALELPEPTSSDKASSCLYCHSVFFKPMEAHNPQQDRRPHALIGTKPFALM